MMKYKGVLLVLFVVLASGAPAQMASYMKYGNLKVRLIYTDGRAVNDRPLVQLMSGAGLNAVAEDYANEEGMVTFPYVEWGTYHVRVTGQGIEDTDSGMVEVDERKGAQSLFVSVRRLGEGKSGAAAGGPAVAAADLRIPAKARKEFDKASDLLNQQEWQKAIERLKRALDSYPNYAPAYNNLAVAYGKLGDRLHERESLEHAVSINDHFAAAFVNLAKMDIRDHNLPEAETFLSKATAADPINPETLMLLANIELVEKQYQEAILNCQKVHAMAHERYAVVHYIAARAFEHLNRLREAAAELQTFLQEEPSGPRSEGARKELASLEQHLPQ
jgi:tetratricopeptide (TPR) repeat protein